MPFLSVIRLPFFPPLSACLLLLASALSLPASAERADRGKPLEVVADTQGSIDMLKQVVVFTGNVVVTKGTLAIRADRVEVREGANGYRNAIALGTTRQATFSQKRDGVEETIEGRADRLEYDERGDVVRFLGNAMVRRMQGKTVGDEITGEQITYDSTSEVFNVSGGSARGADAASGASRGRVRAVLAPRAGSEAAAVARDASAPAQAGDRK